MILSRNALPGIHWRRKIPIKNCKELSWAVDKREQKGKNTIEISARSAFRPGIHKFSSGILRSAYSVVLYVIHPK